MFYNLIGNDNFKMMSFKPEVPITQIVDTFEDWTKLQMSRGPSNKFYNQQSCVGSGKCNMASFKPEVLISQLQTR